MIGWLISREHSRGTVDSVFVVVGVTESDSFQSTSAAVATKPVAHEGLDFECSMPVLQYGGNHSVSARQTQYGIVERVVSHILSAMGPEVSRQHGDLESREPFSFRYSCSS